MPKPYDATLNAILDSRPGDWADFLAARLGLPTGPAESLDTDLSTTLQADRLFRVNAPTPFALHLELETSGALGTPERLHRYNVNAWAVTGLPVHSVLVLLRPKANASDLTGHLDRRGADGRVIHAFRYDVVRVWQEPMEGLLAGLGLAPLALLTREAGNDLPAAVGRLAERLQAPEVDPPLRDVMLHAALILGGMMYDRAALLNLYRRLPMVNLAEESSTGRWLAELGLLDAVAKGYPLGVVLKAAEEIERHRAEGQVEAARRALLRLGAKKFGSPDAATAARVTALADIAELERLSDRLLDVTTWADLFAVI